MLRTLLSGTGNSRFPTPSQISFVIRPARAEGVRFELTVPFETPVFKTGAIDHSATPPYRVLYHVSLMCTALDVTMRSSLSTMIDDGTVLRWSAYEHEHLERSSDWYWALGIVTFSIAVTSVLFHDILFAILVLVAAVTLALLSRTPPELVQFELSERGLRINDKLHRYDEILGFWIDEHRGKTRLLVDTTKWLAPNLVLPIEHIEPGLIRAFLKERVEERFMKESPAHRILEIFGL